MRRTSKATLAALGCFVLLLGVGHVYQTRSTQADMRAHPAPGKLINVNGRKLHLNCRGTGSPTVVLEAGLGESSLSWHPVMAEVAKLTRVCAYDRAGLGWSEGADHLFTPEEVAAELRQLLAGASVTPPFVPVGHSRGGLYCRSFHRQFAEDVWGMVLVDSAHEAGAARELSLARRDYLKQRLQLPLAIPLSSVGLLRAMGWLDADRMPSPLPPQIVAAKTAVQNRTSTVRAAVNEIKVMRRSLEEGGVPPTSSLGNLPLIVIASGLRADVALAEARALAAKASAPGEVAIAALRMELQRELAALSSRGTLVVAKRSGHYIMYDEPDVVVRSIANLIERHP